MDGNVGKVGQRHGEQRLLTSYLLITAFCLLISFENTRIVVPFSSPHSHEKTFTPRWRAWWRNGWLRFLEQ